MPATINKREDRVISGRRYYYVTVSETATAAADEYEIEGVPFETGQIVHLQVTLTGGTGTTVQPRFGKVTGWSNNTQDEVAIVETAAIHINSQEKANFSQLQGSLWVNSQVNAGADNVIETTIILAEGHQA